MPGQRLIQPGQGHSRKVSALSDFDYRVFEQVKSCSDDFGLMPLTASILKAANLRLRKATEKQLEDALGRMVEAGLLASYEHQGEQYVCAPAWQRGQTIEFPRTTHHPKPQADVIATLEPDTQLLLCLHPGGSGKYPNKKTVEKILAAFANESGTTLESILKRFSNESEMISGVPNGTPANANATQRNANASSEESPRETSRPSLVSSMKPYNAWQGQRLEVPQKWHDDHVRMLGGPADAADRKLRLWYATLDGPLQRAQTPVGNWFRYLDACYRAWVPETTPGDNRVARELAESEARRRSVARP